MYTALFCLVEYLTAEAVVTVKRADASIESPSQLHSPHQWKEFQHMAIVHIMESIKGQTL